MLNIHTLSFKDIESTNNTQKHYYVTNNKDNYYLTPTLYKHNAIIKHFSPQSKVTSSSSLSLHYKGSLSVHNNKTTPSKLTTENKLPKIKLKDLLTNNNNNEHNNNNEQELFNIKLQSNNPSKHLPFYKRKQHKLNHLQLPRLIKHINSTSNSLLLFQKEQNELKQIRNQNKFTLQKYINNSIKHTQHNVITSLKELKQIRENINKKYEYITNHLANYKSVDDI
jgi:hypothetical protein